MTVHTKTIYPTGTRDAASTRGRQPTVATDADTDADTDDDADADDEVILGATVPLATPASARRSDTRAALAANMIELFALAIFLVAPHMISARSDMYYDIVGDVLAGHDYYALLGVDASATVSEIRRAYHKISVQHHPDKQVADDSAADAEYFLLARAYSVLKDASARGDFDFLRVHGVPLMARMERQVVRTNIGKRTRMIRTDVSLSRFVAREM